MENPESAAPRLEWMVTDFNDNGAVKVYLSRHNLITLLNKLEQNRFDPGSSHCTIIKNDYLHPKYPQTHYMIAVKAIEDDDYYQDREPGPVKNFDREES